jgi:hypothetical protein
MKREQIFANICSLGRKCSTSVTMLTSEKLISTPDREKTMLWPSQMSKKSKPNDKSMMDIDNTVNL